MVTLLSHSVIPPAFFNCFLMESLSRPPPQGSYVSKALRTCFFLLRKDKTIANFLAIGLFFGSRERHVLGRAEWCSQRNLARLCERIKLSPILWRWIVLFFCSGTWSTVSLWRLSVNTVANKQINKRDKKQASADCLTEPPTD